MTEAQILRERFRSCLKILELTNLAAVSAKRQIEQIFDVDASTGEDLILLPSHFEIDGHVYHAMVTPEQRQYIVVKSQDHTLAELLDLILTNLFQNRLYTAARMAEAILIAALTVQELPLLVDPGDGHRLAGLKAFEVESPAGAEGACQFPNICREPFGKTLCISQGGQFVDSCARLGGDDVEETDESTS